jgi:hypothetical protein
MSDNRVNQDLTASSLENRGKVSAEHGIQPAHDQSKIRANDHSALLARHGERVWAPFITSRDRSGVAHNDIEKPRQ